MAIRFDTAGAKAAGYSDAEIQSYIASKSQPATSSATTTTPPKPENKPGLLGSIAKSVTDPFRKAAGFGTDLVLKNKGLGGSEEMRKKNPFINEEEQSKLNTPGGAAVQQAKNYAGIGANFVPFGRANTAGQFLTKLVAPGMAAGGLQAVSEDDASLASVGGGIVGGGLTAGALGLGGKAVGALKKGGEKIVGNPRDYFKAAFTLPRKIAERLDLDRAADAALKYNISGGLDDIIKNANKITGKSGVITRATREALGRTKTPVNTNAALDAAQFAADNATNVDKAVLDKTIAKATRMISKVQGSLPGKGSAIDVFDIVQSLEDEGYKLANKSTDLTPDVSLEQQADVFLAAADAIKDQMDVAVVDEKVLDKIKNQFVKEALKVSPDLAVDFMNAKTLRDLRAIAKPWVDLTTASRVTKNTQTAPLTQAAKGLSGLDFAKPGTYPGAIGLNTPSGQMRSARALKAAGDFGSKLQIPDKVKSVTTGILSRLGGIGGSEAMSGTTPQPEITEPIPTADVGEQEIDLSQGGVEDTSTSTKRLNPYGVSPEELYGEAVAAYQFGDEDTGNMLMQMYQDEIDYEERTTVQEEDTELAQAEQQRAALSTAGLRAISEAQDTLEKAQETLLLSSLPGSIATRTYENQSFRAVDALLRLRTGQAAPESEVRRYIEKFLPRIGDNQETIDKKLDAFYKEMQDSLKFTLPKDYQISVTNLKTGKPEEIPAGQFDYKKYRIN